MFAQKLSQRNKSGFFPSSDVSIVDHIELSWSHISPSSSEPALNTSNPRLTLEEQLSSFVGAPETGRKARVLGSVQVALASDNESNFSRSRSGWP